MRTPILFAVLFSLATSCLAAEPAKKPRESIDRGLIAR